MNYKKFLKSAGWLLVLILSVGLLFGCGKKPEQPPVQTTAAFTVVEQTTAAQTVAETITETEAETKQEVESQADDKSDNQSQAAPETQPAQEPKPAQTAAQNSTDTGSEMPEITEEGIYTTKNEVAFYLHTYGHLPSNYITKKKAEAAGWVSSQGNLQEVCPGMSIGGDRFGNYEGQLPDKKGRKYTECDIDYKGGKRNAKRIIFSNDGLIFYTEDHYKTFEQLY